MLKSKTVAKLIETTLNWNDKGEKFRVVYEVGSYKGADINCVLKQGKGTITPIANYTNVKTPFTLELIVPMQCGEDRVDTIVDIVNGLAKEFHGKVKGDIDNGRAIFLFNPLEIGNYETRATAGQSVLIKVDFFVEYSTKVGTKYEMALVNTPFEYGTQNVRRFKDEDEKISWVSNLAQDTNAPFYEILTPNINSLVIVQQRYLNPRLVDVNDLSMFNYAIIKETKWNDDVNYYFYYITGSNIDQYNTLVVDLKLDTLTTFYNKIEFGDCFISRAHLDRFVPNSDGLTVSFNSRIDSPLFEREDFKNVEKKLTDRKVIIPFDCSSKLYEWYNKYILGWLYVYVGGEKTYNVVDLAGNTTQRKVKLSRIRYKALSSTSYGSVYNTIACFAVPVFKEYAQFTITNDILSVDISTSAIDDFILKNSANDIYSIKFSIVPPIDFSKLEVSDFEIKDSWLKLKAESVYDNTPQGEGIDKLRKFEILDNYVIKATDGGYGFFHLAYQTVETFETTIDMNTFNGYFRKDIIYKSNIVKKPRNINLNPKLYSSDFKCIKISDNTQNGAEYDILKLSNDIVTIKYTEPLTPDITKKYIRIVGSSSQFYNKNTSENLTGFINSDDTSLMVENTAYASVLANNKNFFLQNSINRSFDVGQGVFGAITGALQGAFFTGGNPIGAITGAGVSIAQTSFNSVKSKINENLSVDNLKNAPNSVSGALGNSIFQSMYSDVGIVIEYYDILPFEKQIIDDQMYLHGFTFNKVDNIKKYDNIRKYFNFIQANIENIIGEISTPIREDIKQRFADGVRFWNSDTIDYSQENYERWLEE